MKFTAIGNIIFKGEEEQVATARTERCAEHISMCLNTHEELLQVLRDQIGDLENELEKTSSFVMSQAIKLQIVRLKKLRERSKIKPDIKEWIERSLEEIHVKITDFKSFAELYDFLDEFSTWDADRDDEPLFTYKEEIKNIYFELTKKADK